MAHSPAPNDRLFCYNSLPCSTLTVAHQPILRNMSVLAAGLHPHHRRRRSSVALQTSRTSRASIDRDGSLHSFLQQQPQSSAFGRVPSVRQMPRSASLNIQLGGPQSKGTYVEPALTSGGSSNSDDTLVHVPDEDRDGSWRSSLQDGCLPWQYTQSKWPPQDSYISCLPSLTWNSLSRQQLRNSRCIFLFLLALTAAGLLYTQGVASKFKTRLFSNVPPSPLPPLHSQTSINEQHCNPFAQPGLLKINVSYAPDNAWKPFASSCPPSTLMNPLLQKELPKESRHDLTYLQNRTVAVVGDSVDRNHLVQFCELAGGNLDHVTSYHPASPEIVKDEHSSQFKEQSQRGEDLARPRVCHVERVNLTLVSIFQYGLVEPDEYKSLSEFFVDDHFYPPYAMDDRITHIMQPLFNAYGRTKPDLVVFGSSFWDTAHWARWRIANGPGWMTSLPEPQIDIFAKRFIKALKMLHKHPLLDEAKTILWRTAHEPAMVERVPGDLVMSLDAVAEATITALQHPEREPPRWMTRKELQSAESRALGEKVRMDYSGRMMNGQRQFMKDNLHPSPLPNAKVWGDILLYELQRVVGQ